MSILRRMLDRWGPLPALPHPDQPVCLIGDIHGRLDLLQDMMELIGAQPGRSQTRIIVLGDMIDRGPDSAGVLKYLHALQTAAPDRLVCLMGNHERMMLDFITSPDMNSNWLRGGGAETIRSYGLAPDDPPEKLSEELGRAVPTDVLTWLRNLPFSWADAGLLAVHAGADPALPAHLQQEKVLLWGHPAFGKRSRSDGIWVVCGHTIVPEPVVQNGRVAVDTGAWKTGVLSAAWMDDEGLRFLQTGQA